MNDDCAVLFFGESLADANFPGNGVKAAGRRGGAQRLSAFREVGRTNGAIRVTSTEGDRPRGVGKHLQHQHYHTTHNNITTNREQPGRWRRLHRYTMHLNVAHFFNVSKKKL